MAMVVQSFLEADDDGRTHFLASSGDSMNLEQTWTLQCQGSDLSPDSAYPTWMAFHNQSTEWFEPWADPHWQSIGAAPDSAAAWEACQQQQWTATVLASSRSWAGADTMAASVNSQVLTKPGWFDIQTMQWTEMSLDPEKPATPANNKARPCQVGAVGSNVKLPVPVGSGRRQANLQEATEVPKMLVVEGAELWSRGALPLDLSLTSAAVSQSASPESPQHLEDPISRLVSGSLPLSFDCVRHLRTLASSTPASMPTAPSAGCTASATPSCGSSSPDLEGTTTVMVRNVPSSVKQSGFVKELEDTGFGGLIDFCYLPSAFDTGKNKGYAFVNFIDTPSYSAFVEAWHGSRRFNARAADPALNVSAAALQGLERNIEKWDAPRMRRVRNPEYRPFVVKNGRMPSALAAVADEVPASSVLGGSGPPGLPVLQGGYEREMPPPPGLPLPAAALTL